ncbi:acyl carrier protein [Streptomyces sp. CT34]|uniref:acyl carrier protein n=1 Tax=Streptomyces sp. CT34 TaxID=1553907 RepID=UPI0005B98169|nr:acyl carrier protein [Streptomyces sp. CT34]
MFTVEDVIRILRAGAGADEQIDLGGKAVADTEFAELGYDSLALLEFVNRIEREYGIEIPDGDVEKGSTPQEVVTYVNGRLVEVAR